jgi:hypothetical protein
LTFLVGGMWMFPTIYDSERARTDGAKFGCDVFFTTLRVKVEDG